MTRLLLGICLAALTYAQTDGWLTFHGDYSGQRHTNLAEITPDNVAKLQQVWRFETHQNQQIKASPIVAGGVIYITTPDNIWAVDARTAAELWHYQNPPNDAFHIGHRGAAIYKDTVYLTTPDCHLIALNAKDGKVKWDVVIADSNKGYWSSNAPLVVRNHVLVGVSGDFDNLPGQLKSIDADTGKTQWIFYSTPPPGAKEPNSGGATGGQMWTTGTYDPDLNLVYVGTGNPTPVLNGAARPGDNLWTCSIVALNPDTGKLVWGFQVSPHDTHDWDANEVPVLADADFSGQPRKLLMQASRNGYFFVLDRTNGKSLLTTPFATVNWAKGIDAAGTPDSGSGQVSIEERRPGSTQRERRHELPPAELSIRGPACSSSALRTATESISSNPSTEPTVGPAPIMASRDGLSSARSITRRERSYGIIRSAMARARPACSPPKQA